jgi:hypothetical protein
MGGPPDDYKISQAVTELSDWVRNEAGVGIKAGAAKNKPGRHWSFNDERRGLCLVLWLFDRDTRDNSGGLRSTYVPQIREHFAGLCLKYGFDHLPAQRESWYANAVKEAKGRGYDK